MAELKLNDYLSVECNNNQKINFLNIIKLKRIAQFDAIYLIRKLQFAKSGRSKRNYQRKLIHKYGIFCGSNTQIGLGLKLPHPNGIIIGDSVVIGDNVTIYQQVTIGSVRLGDWKNGKQPCVKSNSILFSGAKVLGAITLEEGTSVGANAVLTKNTAPGSTWVGIPAKPLPQ